MIFFHSFDFSYFHVEFVVKYQKLCVFYIYLSGIKNYYNEIQMLYKRKTIIEFVTLLIFDVRVYGENVDILWTECVNGSCLEFPR